MTKIRILQADITALSVDAVVNAANRSLLGGGGVDGAIHRAAGPELQEECALLGGCQTGESKITKGYNLPAKYIIHTVGPIYQCEDGQEAVLLANCYRHSLELAQQCGIKTIAFPSISTGAFHYPIQEAAKIALVTVKEYMQQSMYEFEEIIFVLFGDLDYKVYRLVDVGEDVTVGALMAKS